MARWLDWIQDRFGFEPLRKAVLDRRVPITPWYAGDGATLFLLLIVLVVTGAVMALTYTPTPEAAYASVERITNDQTLGWFVRALHYWSAGLMMVMLVFHVFRQLLSGGYKAPREGTWLTGVVIFVLVWLMSYSGYVLRWDERGIAALQVLLHIVSRVPWIGDELVVFVQGEGYIGGPALTRMYAVHVIIVPLLLLALTGYHLYLVILHGTMTPLEQVVPISSRAKVTRLYDRQAESEVLGETFHPETSTESGTMAMTVVLIAILLALFAGPAELLPPASLTEPAFPAEEWWFWWVSGLVGLLPAWAAPWVVLVLPLAIVLVLVLLPFVDRGPFRGVRQRPVALALVTLTVLSLLYLSDVRRRSPWTAWPDPEPPPVPLGVVLPSQAERGRQLFAAFGCNTCHPVSGHGPPFAPALARLPALRTRAYMRDYILAPPTGVAMPAYAGRISEEELDDLLDFVHGAQMFPRR